MANNPGQNIQKHSTTVHEQLTNQFTSNITSHQSGQNPPVNSMMGYYRRKNVIPINPYQNKQNSEKKDGSELEDIELFNAQSAWLGPNLWGQGDRMYTDPNFKLEYMELDEFLQENGIGTDNQGNRVATNGNGNQVHMPNNCGAMINHKEKCCLPYSPTTGVMATNPPMTTSPTLAGSPGPTTPATPMTPHRNNGVPFDVPKEILALATAPAPLLASIEHRRCSSTDSLSLSCHIGNYSSSQGSPGSSTNGSRGSSSCGSPPPPFYDSTPHYTDISHMTPRHQQHHGQQHPAAAASALSSGSNGVQHPANCGVDGAASVDLHQHHRVRRRRGHLTRFHSESTEEMIHSPGQDEYDPRKHQLSEDELRPQPMVKKSRKNIVPCDHKDDKYWMRRKKNNLAAKRSRDARRIKENQIAMRANFLQKQNEQLQMELENAQADNQELRKRLNKYESV